ncbi:sperm-associated microtubule inner protein 4 isoform X2 [Ambystoma mexicanum]
MTQLKRSAVRPSDDLLPKPPDASMTMKQIYQRFPAEHPYQSHISKFAMFPNYTSPDDLDTGVRARSAPPLHPHTPASGHEAIVLRKTAGNPFRHEVLKIHLESMKKALNWPGQHGYFHIPKFSSGNEQRYYPMPPKMMAPNMTLRPWDDTISQRSANLLRNVEKSQWITTYKQSFTGRGPMNPLHLDDFHAKLIGKLTGTVDGNAELKELYLSAFLPARPVDGRTARVLQDRRLLELPDLESASENPEEDDLGPAPGIPFPSYPQEQYHSDAAIYDNPQQCSPVDEMKNYCAAHPSHCTTSRFNAGCESVHPEFPNTVHYQSSMPKSDESHDLNINHKPFHFEKITDTCANDALYRRQLTARPASPEPGPKQVCYEDLPRNKRDHFTVWKSPFSLSKPMSPADSGNPGACTVKSLEHRRDVASAPPHVRAVSSSRAEARPHTGLQELEDSYSKSEAHKMAYQTYPEEPKDLRDNSYSGKRTTFYGLNSFYFH